MTLNATFKTRLAGREQLLGLFVKTPHPIITEVLGHAGVDFVILDAEHAPFDRAAVDTCAIAARATGCPLLVRIPNDNPDTILGMLDCGISGIVVPHVKSAQQAAEIVRNTRYGQDQGRGFAGTTRAADYARRSLSEHFDLANREVSVICQIEDPEGYDAYEDIAAVDGVDALFVGRADLAVSYGANDFHAPEIGRKCAEVLGAKDSATGLYCAPGEDISRWRDAGASLFVIGSEHSLMMQGIARIRQDSFGG